MVVRVPATLSQRGRSGSLELEIAGGAGGFTVRDALGEIEKEIPGATAKIVSAEGKIHGYVNLYVNGDDVRHGDGLDTTLTERDELIILPAISGG